MHSSSGRAAVSFSRLEEPVGFGKVLPLGKDLGWALLLFLLASCEAPDSTVGSVTDNFEALWTQLDQKYCFFDYKAAEYGLDWDEVHDRYAAQVADTLTSRAFFDLMAGMVNELRDGHTNLIGPWYTSSYSAFYADYPHNFSSDLLLATLGHDYYYSHGTYYRILPDSIGYVYINSFSSTLSDAFVSELFRYFSACRGLVVDVRDNGGGSLEQSRSLSARFMKEKTLVGYISHKTGPAHDAFSDPVPMYVEPDTTLSAWLRPVCVLTNRHSFSATNDFVRVMRRLPHVTIVGDRTGGGSGLPMSTDIPCGWTLRYSASPIYDVDMQHTEFGIDPDVRVDITPQDLLSGHDAILHTAVSLLMSVAED